MATMPTVYEKFETSSTKDQCIFFQDRWFPHGFQMIPNITWIMSAVKLFFTKILGLSSPDKHLKKVAHALQILQRTT